MKVKRTIKYVSEDEDLIRKEADFARSQTVEENYQHFFASLRSTFAMMGVDPDTMRIKRTIKYASE